MFNQKMQAQHPFPLLKICTVKLATYTLDAIVRSCAMDPDRKCSCPHSRNQPKKRKRSNSHEMEIFNSIRGSSSFSISKRRKLNKDGNWNKRSFLDEHSGNFCRNILEIPLVPELQEINYTSTFEYINTISDPAKSAIRDPVIILRLYFKYIPLSLWTEFTTILLKELSKSNKQIHQQIYRTVYELLFCSKLTRYSSSAMSGHEMEAHILVERLSFCRNLRTLEYNFPAYLHRDQSKFYEQFLQAISSLKLLRKLSFTPSQTTIDTAYSIFSVMSNFKLLMHFTLFYDCGQTTERVNVSYLKNCPHLEDVALYSFGKGSEMEYLVELLKELKNLQFIYHRELPNALMHLYSKNINSIDSIKLKLKSFVLVAPKRNFGSQLVYIPISSLVQVARMCPLLSNLTLVKPGNLINAVELITGMSSLTIHSCNFKESLEESIKTNKLQSLRSLRLINTETAITYNDIINISMGCQKIEELEVFNSNLISTDVSNRQEETYNPLFPFLKKLILLSLEVHSCREPFIATDSSQWILGMTLAKLLLRESKLLETLYLEFTPSESLRMDRLSSELLLTLLTGNSNLKELLLWSSPEISISFIDNLVQWCPNLRCLRQLNLWNFATPTDESEVRKRYNYLVS